MNKAEAAAARRWFVAGIPSVSEQVGRGKESAMATALRGLSGSRGGARRQTTPPPQLRPLDRVPSTHLVEGKRRIPTCCASGAPDPHTPHAVGRRPSLAALLAAAAAASVGGGSALPATASYVEQDVAQAVYEARKRSVVSLADLAITGDNEVLEGVGSGVVWDALGHIITNYHCVSKLANDRSGAQVSPLLFLSRSPLA